MPKDSSKASIENKEIVYILTYLLSWITGLIVYFTKAQTDNKAKFHAIQAILLGLISVIISIIIIPLFPIVWILSFLIWIYGLYIGYQAYSGNSANIPYLSGYAHAHSDYGLETESKAYKKTKVTNSKAPKPEDKALSHLKMRFVKGEISKKKYNEMKKELE